MADRIRFHMDENVNPVIADALRRHGIDVTTTIEAARIVTSLRPNDNAAIALLNLWRAVDFNLAESTIHLGIR